MTKQNIYIKKQLCPNLSPASVLITSRDIQVSLPEWSGRMALPDGADYLRSVIALAEEVLSQLESPMTDLDNADFDDIDYADFYFWCDEFSLDNEFGDITCTDEREYDDLKSRLENELQRLTQADDSEFIRSIKIDFLNFALTDLGNLIWRRDFINDAEAYIEYQEELERMERLADETEECYFWMDGGHE
jgi:hypothetical protein